MRRARQDAPRPRPWPPLLAVLALCAPPTVIAQSVPALPPRAAAETEPLPTERVLTVDSPYQTGPTRIRILPPARLEPDKKYPAVYVLPVEAAGQSRYGDGLREVARHNLPDRLSAVFVAPEFSHLPWYADHPSDAKVRQESHLLKVVLPEVERTLPVRTDAAGRLLLGFSKSGWGAWSLLLRHPDLFGRAVAWDAPLMMDRIGLYGTRDILGSQEHFDRYRPDLLLRSGALPSAGEPRLILTGYGNFRQHHQQAHRLLSDLRIPHLYRDGPARKHDWHSGWVVEAAELLLDPADREDRVP